MHAPGRIRETLPPDVAAPADNQGVELTDAELDMVVGGLERVFFAYQAGRARSTPEERLAPP